ncbi:alpha-xylosidase [Loigolactobacillus backii]|uniref:Alpha-xylosidase n=2 Tax=Loigolactobacillus backii TaxID=375175 RepID=A0A192H6A1_9LACO|nr:alpha-xylosidase [Loigolactobacillus backii]ANK63521.1 alpha-xylosidase [Loigolactobacillus backii]ANK68398.1 alpha-xylosidase [Loigolactobacillus backii]ANK70859.1 alpha-xylosidase [Loigolactobacillus backii]OLF69099.1 alpha-xylosidase [Loigolactobacillus backii]
MMEQKINTNSVSSETYRFTVLTSRLVRIEYSADGHFEDHFTQIVQNRDLGRAHFEVYRQRNHHELEIVTDYFHLYYEGGPLTPASLYIDTKYGYSDYANRWYFGQAVETLKGTVRTLDKADGAVDLDEGLMSRNGYSVMDDSRSFIIEGETVRPRTALGEDWYYFAYGHDYLACLRDFYRLTGFPPQLPRYALGNWWSRYLAYSQSEYKSLFEKFTQNEIPFSVAVLDMDWHLIDIPHRFGSGWTGYTWNKELFPDPEALLTWLHEIGKRVTVNLHPADGIRAYEASYSTVAKHLNLDTAAEEPALFNLSDSAFRESYFNDVHHPLEKQGIDFWWVDWQQGKNLTPQLVDPLWLLNHYHFRDHAKRHEAGLILSRYAGFGSHRYPIGFSGDTIVSWKSLAFQPYFTATASNVGYTWWSHDIGGHMHGERDDELALRWLQFGVFSPIMRLHGSGNPFSGKEPWNYKEPNASIMREYLRLRHQLIPYLETANYRTHTLGQPLVQPMYYHYDQPEAYEQQNQALFGSELLVAPIISPKIQHLDQSKVTVWFPPGQWFDWFTGLRYRGDVTLNVYRDERRYPVFVKAGGIVPLNPDSMADATQLPETLLIRIFPEANNRYVLAERQGERIATTTFIWNWDQRKLQIEVQDPASILPNRRRLQLEFNALGTFSIKANDSADISVENNQVTWRQGDSLQLQLIDCEPVQQRDAVTERLFDKLKRAQINFDLKRTIWQKFLASKNKGQFVSFLNTLDDQDLARMLYEIVYLL